MKKTAVKNYFVLFLYCLDNIQFPPWHLDEDLLAEHRIEEYFWNDTNLSYREWVNSPHGCQPYPRLHHHNRYAPY